MALVIMAMISELHLHGKLESRPLQVAGATFFLCNKYILRCNAGFGQYISFVVLVTVGMIRLTSRGEAHVCDLSRLHGQSSRSAVFTL